MAVASAQTDTRERVGVVEGDEPAATKERPLAVSADPQANIIMRLWRAELDIGAVEKAEEATVKTEGGQVAYKYKFTGYDVVVAAVKPALAKHGIKVLPTTVEHSRNGNLTVLTVSVDFINVDQPTDKITVQMTNYGADKGDKGASKALTNAVREAIKKALGITSVEDDRADETTEYESEEGLTKADLEKAKEAGRATLEKWAQTFRAALLTAKTKKDIQRLQTENKDQLANLPDVTRDFFIDLIETRKKELPE